MKIDRIVDYGSASLQRSGKFNQFPDALRLFVQSPPESFDGRRNFRGVGRGESLAALVENAIFKTTGAHAVRFLLLEARVHTALLVCKNVFTLKRRGHRLWL